MAEIVASAVSVHNSISCHMDHTVSVFQSACLNAAEMLEYWYLRSCVSAALLT